MPGAFSQDRTPGAADVRVRRNNQRFTAGDTNIIGGILSLDDDGRVTLAHSDVDHDQTTNFVADEHVAHSGVTLTAGDGITGGGDISASRTFAVDYSTGLQIVGGQLTTKDSEISHDSLSGFVADEHIDWTGATSNFLTTGSITLDADTTALFLGDGQDSSLYYDGTNLVVNPKVVGTGTLNVLGRIEYDGAFADIYVADASTAQSIPTGTTYTKMTGFTTNGESENATADAANDKITLTKTGYYFVSVSLSADSGTNNVLFYFACFLGGVEQNQVHATRFFNTASEIGSCSLSGIIKVTTADTDLDLRARHDNGSAVDITPEYVNMCATYIGKA